MNISLFVRPAGVAALALSLLGSAGCAGFLFGRPVVNLYEIAPAVEVDPGWPALGKAIVVQEPEATGVVLSDRIPVLEERGRISLLAGAVWEKRAPLMVQDMLVRAFEQSGKVPLVERLRVTVSDGYALRSELRQMRVERRTDGSLEATSEIAVRVMSVPAFAFVAGREFRASMPARSARPDDVVAAFDVVWARLGHDIVGWFLTTAQPR